jgi:hypothetical protein
MCVFEDTSHVSEELTPVQKAVLARHDTILVSMPWHGRDAVGLCSYSCCPAICQVGQWVRTEAAGEKKYTFDSVQQIV